MASAPVHRFTFDSPDRALHFVRRIFVELLDVVTFRDGCTVLVIDGHEPRQASQLLALAKDLGSVPHGAPSVVPPPLPTDRPSRLPTQPAEEEVADVDVEWDEDEKP